MLQETEQPADRPRRHLARIVVIAAVAVACAVAGIAFIMLAPLPTTPVAGASTLGRGIIDYRLEQAVTDVGAVPAIVAEMGSSKLRARWTRLQVHWAALQPVKPGTSSGGDKNGDGYADAYVAQLDAITSELHKAGISVIMTPLDTPKWASDRSWWTTPPPGFKKGRYYPFYAPDMKNLTVSAQYKKVGTFLAKRYAGKVKHFEAWNEPNLGTYLYPQVPASAKSGGASIYLKMLKAWHAGVKAGSRDAVVIAGATSPRGRGDVTSTPPQAFARYLKANGASAYMDAYSHHPYTPGGSTRVAPGDLPNNPDRCVTLGNLGTLTRIFPTKPFYLTEYGYNTQYSRWFGVTVSPADQARYLRQAYAYAARNRQVKALLWFLVDDWNPSGNADKAGNGVYMGVRTYKGVRKPSWYAFAGGNAVSLKTPASAESNASFTISGKLTYRAPATSQSQVLTIQARSPSGSEWKTLLTVDTARDGSYSRPMKQGASRVYRVLWGGVCQSAEKKVTTP